MSIDATATIARDSRPLSGEGLWQLSLYGSRNEDGSGLQFNYIEQLLNVDQEGQSAGPDLPLDFPDLETRFDISSVGCGQFAYLCLELQKGRVPMPDYQFQTRTGDDRIRSCKQQECMTREFELSLSKNYICNNVKETFAVCDTFVKSIKKESRS